MEKLFKYHPDGYLIRKTTTNYNAKAGDRAGHKDAYGYIIVKVTQKSLKVHRVIWEMHNGPIPKGMTIDHINHIRDDNRIENLRMVRQGCQLRNLSKQYDGQVMGVTFAKREGKWVANIRTNGKTKFLGYFSNRDDAIKVRKEAEVKYGYHKNHGV